MWTTPETMLLYELKEMEIFNLVIRRLGEGTWEI